MCLDLSKYYNFDNDINLKNFSDFFSKRQIFDMNKNNY